jgi:hypothetical protein
MSAAIGIAADYFLIISSARSSDFPPRAPDRNSYDPVESDQALPLYAYVMETRKGEDVDLNVDAVSA